MIRRVDIKKFKKYAVLIMAVALFMVCFASSASAREIGAGAFSNCHSLKEVVILGEVKDLSGVFSDCSNLEKASVDKTEAFCCKEEPDMLI